MEFFPELFGFDLLKDHPRDGPTTMKHYAILPHELFSSLYHSSEDLELFEFLLTGGGANLAKWWDDASREGGSWYANHPCLESQPEPTKRVPVGLHRDEAGARGGADMFVLTWGSTAVSLPTPDSSFIFTIHNGDEAVRDEAQTTLRTIYSVFLWSIRALATGYFLFADHNGKPFSKEYMPGRFAVRRLQLAGGYIGSWAELRGDWKFLKDYLFKDTSRL